MVTSRFNSEITEKLESGAFEIPLATQALLDLGCDGVVALGCVIRGETSHYDYVCNSVERGVTELMLQYKKPIGFGVLTTENDEQAEARAGGKHGNKGAEAAEVVMEMIGLLKNLKSSNSK